jgi:DEAD/DEAH box helicase domain-containing protein
MLDPRRIGEILSSRPVHGVQIPARDAVYADIPDEIPDMLRGWLGQAGIKQLYSHQAEAVEGFSRGEDLMVLTGTGSGKSLCYVLPALKACLDEPAARCLFLFPTKALAQDQLGKLGELIPADQVLCATYDGDTERSGRSAIRRQANIVLTNPDMLHIGMLPGHENWLRFLKNLRLIVIDEAHVYRGAFGGHFGWVIRRLLRLCAWHGARPQIIACSATISNAAQHFEDLTGRTASLITKDGAPQGEKQVLVVEAVDDEAGEARSPNSEVAEILAEAVTHGVKTMVFCRSRNGVELVLRAGRNELKRLGGDPEWIDAYRGGYTPTERRDIENRLFSGDLRGITTTNAMELGVDVGGLDLVILNGYPGSRASFWQQSGRAGRGGRGGMAMMLAHADPLEQFLARRINLLAGEPEPSLASIRNPLIASRQLKCAIYERPMTWGEIDGVGARAVAEDLLNAGEIHDSAGMLFFPAHRTPAGEVNIRSADNESVQLFVGGTSLGDMEKWRAMQGAHVGAVHLHRGESYIVEAVDFSKGVAFFAKFDGDYYTQPVVQSVIESRAVLEEDDQGDRRASLEAVSVTTLVTGYRKMSLKGNVVLSDEELEPMSRTIDTIALRFGMTYGGVKGFELGVESATGGVHALEHALAAVAPLVAGCDRRDLGSSWYLMAPDRMEPAVYLYDVAPGGLGLVEQCYRERATLVRRALELVDGCKCADGCPLCILSALCECRNENLNKSVVLALLRGWSSSLGQLA